MASKGPFWTIGKMVTEKRAASVARTLFPDAYADGGDCRAEHGRIGEPCRICAARNADWQRQVDTVREAMIKAFS